MRKPFNFFQGAGWGVLPTGKTLEEATFDFMTGLWLLGSVEQGKTAGFTWSNYQTASIGVTPSGQVSNGNVHLTDLSINFEGNLYNLFKESGDLFLSHSGQIVKDNIDTVPFSISFSPKFSGANIDINNLSFVPSGDWISGSSDIVNTNSCFSGSFSGIEFETLNYRVVFRGAFIPPDRDYINPITFELTGVAYEDFISTEITKSYQTGANVSMQIYGIIYEDN